MIDLYSLKITDIFSIVLFLWLSSKLISQVITRIRRNLRLPPLKGPKSKSLLFGVSRYIINSPDSALIYEDWAAEYGLVYQVPGVLGSRRVILCDPKAVAHFFSRETVTYVQPSTTKLLVEKLLGKGIIIAEGDDHKRQRKALTPAFSNIAIRRLTSVFYDSAHKLKASWDAILESSPEGKVIDVQTWMNRVSLDSIGIAGFSHDFNSLSGQPSSVTAIFDSLAGLNPTPKPLLTRILAPVGTIIFLLGTLFPVLFKLPAEQTTMFKKLRKDLGQIAEALFEKTKKERELGIVDEKGDKSIIGLLIKAENPNSYIRLSKEEISAQLSTLLLAGYETTSISLTWALIELCIQPRIQNILRSELLRGSTLENSSSKSDLTWEQLSSTIEFPYLDAIVQETLRLHAPVDHSTRVARTDDIIPLSSPLSLASFKHNRPKSSNDEISGVAVPKGTLVTVPIVCINQSKTFWGEDARVFKPERWLSPVMGGETDEGGTEEKGTMGLPEAAQEISGYRHLLTFSDGPRMCLGKGFALTEFKAVLSFLIRNYTFEFASGKDNIPKIGIHHSILPRPKIEGEEGSRVPVRVRRVE